MHPLWLEASPLEMDDGKIVADSDPTLDPSPSPAMDPLKDGSCHPLATETPLGADPSPLVFEVEGEMGPTPTVVKGLQV